MSQHMHQRILSFVKRNKDDLQESTGIEEFSELVYEIFDQFLPKTSFKEKVQSIVETLSGEDPNEKLVEGDLRNYAERLVKFVEGSEDPLEKNNLKSPSSSGSSDEEDNKGHLKIIKSKKDRDRSRDKEKHKKSSKKKNNLLADLQKKFNMNNINDFIKLLSRNQHQNAPQQIKHIVFLLNVPKELRSYSEIEAMLQGKGQIGKIQLGGKLPSVHFRRPQDAQNLIEQTKFIVHKGVKIEFSLTPHRPQRNEKHQTQAPVQEKPPVVQEKIEEEEPKPAVDEKKEEQDLQAQLEALRSQAKSMIVDKLRLVLLLRNRSDSYNQSIIQEIDQLKKDLIQKKEEVQKQTTLEQLHQEIQWLNDNYDYTLEISELPEQHFKDKTIMKILGDYYKQYGQIDKLQIKLKEKTAHLKFTNFESAEKAYLAQNQIHKVEFLNKGIKKIIKA